MDNLEEFVTDFMADKLEPYLKSEELPADNSGPVKVSFFFFFFLFVCCCF